jgi:uncharacterized protein with FMN-binding domain
VTRRARALVALFVANALAVVIIWWVALDAQTFASPAGTLNALGRITGLVGTYLILVQLILRTHVAWLVTAFGKDALKRWHTWNAYVAFGLLGAHAVLQTVGYALQDRVDLLSELVLLVEHYEGMLLAIAGLLLLAGLTVIALDRFRHRIAWPTWRALHLYTYVAVALSVPHQIATGSDFIDAPLAVTYWTGLLGVTVAILALARVPPLWRAATAAGRPHPAIVAVGALVVAAYLLGTIRFAPAQATIATEARTARPTTGPAPSASAAAAAPSPTAAPAATTVAIEGRPFDTPYGPAQVRLILTAGHIDDVEPVLLPAATKRSKTISASAEYWLRKRAIAAQSAEFEILSGATYTSRAYQSSLESALHIAGLD